MPQEARTLMRCGQLGIRAPAVYLVDTTASRIYMQHMASAVTVRDLLVAAPPAGVVVCLPAPLTPQTPSCP